MDEARVGKTGVRRLISKPLLRKIQDLTFAALDLNRKDADSGKLSEFEELDLRDVDLKAGPAENCGRTSLRSALFDWKRERHL